MSKHQGLQPPAAVIAIAKDYPNVQNPILYRANNVSISIPRRQGTGALQGLRPILMVSVSVSVSVSAVGDWRQASGDRSQKPEFRIQNSWIPEPRTRNPELRTLNAQTPKRRYAHTPLRVPAARPPTKDHFSVCRYATIFWMSVSEYFFANDGISSLIPL
jgi:hypothetical protein